MKACDAALALELTHWADTGASLLLVAKYIQRHTERLKSHINSPHIICWKLNPSIGSTPGPGEVQRTVDTSIDWSEMEQACSARPVVKICSLKEKPVWNSSLSEIIHTHKELFRDGYERICGSRVPNAWHSRGGGSSSREQRYFSGWEKCQQRVGLDFS